MILIYTFLIGGNKKEGYIHLKIPYPHQIQIIIFFEELFLYYRELEGIPYQGNNKYMVTTFPSGLE